jgi:hypothetical protein
VGSEFWKQLVLEHKIGPDGVPLTGVEINGDRKSVFFDEVLLCLYAHG